MLTNQFCIKRTQSFASTSTNHAKTSLTLTCLDKLCNLIRNLSYAIILCSVNIDWNFLKTCKLRTLNSVLRLIIFCGNLIQRNL